MDEKLEVIVIPSRMSTARRSSTETSAGDSTPTMPVATTSASSSSRRQDPSARSSSHEHDVGPPGFVQHLYLIVSDIEAARAELVGRGVEVSEVFHEGGPAPVPSRRHEGSGQRPCARGGQLRLVVSFSDPDGNGWLFQEVTTGFPGVSTRP